MFEIGPVPTTMSFKQPCHAVQNLDTLVEILWLHFWPNLPLLTLLQAFKSYYYFFIASFTNLNRSYFLTKLIEKQFL